MTGTDRITELEAEIRILEATIDSREWLENQLRAATKEISGALGRERALKEEALRQGLLWRERVDNALEVLLHGDCDDSCKSMQPFRDEPAPCTCVRGAALAALQGGTSA